MILHILAMGKSATGGCSALVLVPTRELAHQYQTIIHDLIRDAPVPVRTLVQTLYRSSNDNECLLQESTFEQTPDPNVIVATPTRLLDLLSESRLRPSLVKTLTQMRCLVLDEADSLIPPRKSKHKSMTSKKRRHYHETPTTLLVDSLMQLMPNQRPQLVLASVTASSSLRDHVTRQKWLVQPDGSEVSLICIGGDPRGGVLQNRLPRDVRVGFAQFDPSTKSLTDADLPQFHSVNEAVNNAQLSRACDEAYQKYERSWLSYQGAELLCLTEQYVDAFASLALTIPSGEACLVIIPDRLSPLRFQETLLQKHKIRSDIVTPGRAPTCAVILSQHRYVVGLHFPGLRNVCILSLDNMDSARRLMILAGRCRVADAHNRGEMCQNGSWTAGRPGVAMLVALNSELDDEKCMAPVVALTFAKMNTWPCKLEDISAASRTAASHTDKTGTGS